MALRSAAIASYRVKLRRHDVPAAAKALARHLEQAAEVSGQRIKGLSSADIPTVLPFLTRLDPADPPEPAG